MNWDDLRYILAISRAGSLNEAATILQVNSTTVSRRLKSIEANTGVRLFEKLRDGFTLTAAGEELRRTAEKVEELTIDISAKIEGLDSQLSGELRITSLDTLINLWMKDLKHFQLEYPKINLDLISTYSITNLTKREADIAIRMASKAPDHLIGRKHAEVLFAVYGAPELIERIGHNKSYDHFPWLGWDLSVGRATDRYIEKHVKGARMVMRVDRMDVMLKALENGIGITILPCFAGDPCSKIQRFGTYFEGGTYLWLLTHPDLKSTARVRAFTDYFKKVIARDIDLIEGRKSKNF